MREKDKLKKRLSAKLDAMRSWGSLSLREQVNVEQIAPAESEDAEDLVPEDELLTGVEPDYEKFLPPSPYTLRECVEMDPEYLRKCLADTLLNVSWAYDSLDHKTSSEIGGSAVQHDCYLVRELVDKLAAEHSLSA